MGPNTRHVLIVDDNVNLAENISEILQLDGHTIRLAASAEEGIERVLESAPEVLVTDYRLPGLNGAELVVRLRKSGAHIVALVISAHTDEGTIEDAREAGATFMAKPLDYAVLGRWVRDTVI